ncbi:MAG: acyltransferase family protein [Lachnospiraceae bacterium]|nr:acyltransferase family protein [Lachnospiraceae bacterium]
MNCNKRIEFFDVAKAILIIMVVLGHTIRLVEEAGGGYDITYAEKFINSFHMPAFFIITGVLFNEQKWKEASWSSFLLSRFKTLIIPYLFFEIIDSTLQVFVYKIGIEGFKECLMRMLTVNCNSGPDWFLIAIFIGEVLFLLVQKYMSKSFGIILQITCLIISIALPDNHFCIVIGRALIAFVIIMAGNQLRFVFCCAENYKWKNIIIAFLITLGISYVNGTVNVSHCELGFVVFFLISSISGTFLVLGVSIKVHNDFLLFLGMNTLTIMGIHQRILYLIPRYLPMCRSIIWIFLDMIIVFLIAIPFICIVNEFMPFFVGKKYRSNRLKKNMLN